MLTDETRSQLRSIFIHAGVRVGDRVEYENCAVDSFLMPIIFILTLMKSEIYGNSEAWGKCWWLMGWSSTYGLLVADLHRDHELLHRHHVHWNEVVLAVMLSTRMLMARSVNYTWRAGIHIGFSSSHQLTSSQSKASTWRKCCLLILVLVAPERWDLQSRLQSTPCPQRTLHRYTCNQPTI